MRYKLQQEADVPQIPAMKKEIERMKDCLNMRIHRAKKKSGPRQTGSKNLDFLLDSGLDTHLNSVLEYLTKFGVLLNENGLLTRKMKYHLLRDFEGVKGMYGVVGLRIFKSIKEILIEEKGTEEEVVSSPRDKDKQMVDVATQCSGLLVRAVGFSEECSSNCGVISDNPNDQLKASCSESIFDQGSSSDNIPKSPLPDVFEPPYILSQSPCDTFSVGNDEEMSDTEGTPNLGNEGLCESRDEFSNRSKYQFDAKKCNSNDQLKRGHNFTLESDKRKGEVVSTDNYCAPSPDPSPCIKRQKLNETASIPCEFSSSKLQSTLSKELGNDLTNANDGLNACPSQDDGCQNNRSENLQTATFKIPEVPSPSAPKDVTYFGKQSLNAVLHYNDFIQSPKVQKARKKERDLFRNPRINWYKKNIVSTNTLNPSMPEHTWIKLAVKSLSTTLNNLQLISDRRRLLLHVFRYVYASSISAGQTPGSTFSLQRYEKAVVTLLYEIEASKRIHLKDLLPSAIESLHVLIVSKPALSLWGLCSLCRLFTKLCKLKNLAQKPVSLAADLLKTRNRAAPVLIASIVGVWSKPFEVTETTPDDEKCLQCAISYAVFKSHCDIPSHFDRTVKEVLSKHLCPVPNNAVVLEVVEYLIAKIHLDCVKESSLDIQHTLMAPVVILSAFSDWDWTKKNVLDNYITPSLSKYEQEGNKAAFELFSCFYAEVFSFFPEKSPDMLLKNFLKNVVEGKRFVKDCAAVNLIRILVLQEKAVLGNILNWLKENSWSSRVKSLRPLLKRKMLKLTTSVILEDII